jgi:F-type H+-transporting ATPase subunit alpha
MKEVAGGLRLDMATYQELAAFAQFGSDLDEATQRKLDRGKRLTEILKQPQYEPMDLADQVIIIYAGTNGYADHVSIDQMREYEEELLTYMQLEQSEIRYQIATKKKLTDKTEEALQAALETFNRQWMVE